MTETRRSAVLADCRCKVTAQTARHLREGLRETYALGLALTWSRGCGVLALRPCRLAYAWRAMRLHDASPRSCVWVHTHAHIHPRVATHTPTRIHTCPPVCPRTHPRTPRHTLMYAHACLHVRSRMPMMRPHTLVGSHATARALRIRTHGCPRTMAWAHYARERYAYARKCTGNHRASMFAHPSDLHAHYAPMSHAHTPMHAWGGGRQAHYAPSRNVVRGVTPMRRRGYALCVYGRNTMRDVTQTGVNGCDWVQPCGCECVCMGEWRG